MMQLHKHLSAGFGAISLAVLLATAVPASAASIIIQGGATCFADPGAPPNQGVCAASSSGGGDSEANGASGVGSVTASSTNGSASADATAVLAFGALGGTAHAEAHGAVPGTVPIQSHLAEANFTVRATDTLSVGSSSLAAGTEVTLRFTLVLASSVSGSGTGTKDGGVTTRIFSGDGESNPLGLNLSISDGLTFDPIARSVFQDAIAHVGDVLDFGHELIIGALAQANNDVGPNAIIDVVANNTAHLFIDVIGSDATITTASGTDYSSSTGGPPTGVPAPAGVGLFLLGFAGMTALRRRRIA